MEPAHAHRTEASVEAQATWCVCETCDLRYRVRPGRSCPRCEHSARSDGRSDEAPSETGDGLHLGGSASWVVGGVAAAVGATIWTMVVTFTGNEYGWGALMLGGVVGAAVRLTDPREGYGGPIAMVMAAAGVAMGKFGTMGLAGIPAHELFSAIDLAWVVLAIVGARAAARGSAPRG